MRTKNLSLICIALFAIFLSSCSVTSRSMKTPNYHIEFYKSDFDYSPQLTAEATSVRILGIDWKRLFRYKTGSIESDRFNIASGSDAIELSSVLITDYGNFSSIIPVIGIKGKGKVSSYALYNLMAENPGYDIVIYPQYESNSFIFPIFYSKRTVKVTARLGKIN